MKHSAGLAIGLAALQATAQDATTDLESQCATLLTSLSIPNGTVNIAEVVRAGTTIEFPNADPSCTRPSQAVSSDICRVTLNVTTGATSGLFMEAWLPLSNWTGRFLSTGNGGLGGCIQYEDLAYTSALGFAAVGTNNGHDGMDGRPFYHNSGVVEDFAYRAMHTGVVVGKNISQAFYGKPHTKSYYLGCSTGGREGMKEVQDFPDDFDGVVAGSPAMNMNNLNAWSGHFLTITGANSSDTWVDQSLWQTVVHQDILNQCDGLDGFVDGIIEATTVCNYTVSAAIMCNATTTDNSTCLTPPQVTTVNQVFSPMMDPNGTFLYPRMNPGSELNEAFGAYYTGQPSRFVGWLQYVVFANLTWDAYTFAPAQFGLPQTLNPFNIATFNGDISAFRNKGGRLLSYHGTADGIISSEDSNLYWNHVSQTMGLAASELDEFYRFFRVGGMAHCGGGIGPHFIGNDAGNLGASYEPEDNVLMAMVRWVEEGVAPDTITGTAYVNNTLGNDVAYKRRHCRFPLRNVFNGTGDALNPDSWNCVQDEASAHIAGVN